MNQPISASSSGRLDVMGGIADYSGALVLQMPIRERTTVTLLRSLPDLRLLVHSDGHSAEIDYTALLDTDQRPDYPKAQRYFQSRPDLHWASYVVGCLLVLQREKGVQPVGFEIQVASDVPIGKGVSSSAALEVATMKALSAYYQLHFEGTELPTFAQKVENLIVGAPCGLMDQLACYFGQPQHLLPILCQPDVLNAPIALPTNLRFVGIDSDVRHSVGGASYGEVRTAAFMGLAIINATRSQPLAYLTQLSVAEFEQHYAHLLPRQLLGKDFLEQYQRTPDTVTTVQPEREYCVYQATAHPILEHQRVGYFADTLRRYAGTRAPQNTLQQLGQWMYESHESYTACGLGSEATDRLVAMVREQHGKGVYGAKITGGGSGGTVCVLCDAENGLQTARQIHQQYSREVGKEVAFFE
ncbi:MAG: hypothetical protein MUE30_06920 [Spirosomaceae bacterium]|nr:hypothetical protein [Spirosomataceae bacterium]